MSKKGKVSIIIIVALLIILALGGYIGGVIFFKNHFLPNTRINGVNASYHDVNYVKSTFNKQGNQRDIKVTINDKEHKIKGKDIGVTYNDNKEVDNILKNQDVYKWFLYLDNKKENKVKQSYDCNRKMLDAEIRNISTEANKSNNSNSKAIKETIEKIEKSIEKALKDGVK